MKSDRYFWLLFLVLSAFNAAVLSASGLSADETHYWEWSRRLDWSYYSKGPVVAYLIAASRVLFGDTEWAVRFPAFACFSAFSALIYFFLKRFYTPALALLGFGIVRSMLIFVQTGILMTTDAPAALCWLVAVIGAYLAVVEERRAFWILFGLAVGVGIGAKYTVAFLFCSVLLFLLLTPQTRNHLRAWQFWTGAAVMILALSPIVIWNIENGWVNLAHNAGHVVKSSGKKFSPQFVPELILGQMGLVGPILFILLISAMPRGVRLWRVGDLPAGLFLFSCLPLTVFVLAVSLGKRVYANWPLPIYVGAVLLLIHLLSLRKLGDGPSMKWLRAGIALSAVLSFAAHLPFLGYTFGLPGKILPTKKLAGWRELGEKLSETHVPLVIADDYEVASTAAFYTRHHPRAYCAYFDDRRMNQYDIWGGWNEISGRDALVVATSPEKIEFHRPHFAALEPIGPQPALSIEYSGTPLRVFYIYHGKKYDGFVPALPNRR